MRTLTVAAAATLSAIVMSEISTGRAAEIKVISANGMREVLAETTSWRRPARSWPAARCN